MTDFLSLVFACLHIDRSGACFKTFQRMAPAFVPVNAGKIAGVRSLFIGLQGPVAIPT
tara:strand:- start:1027 stop:1200 length:174 start_codon:yes stop_codon:yes gene_type:complete